EENASAADHDVDLVLLVRRLVVRARRRPQYHVEGAALQQADGAPVRAVRDAGVSLGEAEHTAAVGRAHPRSSWITWESAAVAARSGSASQEPRSWTCPGSRRATPPWRH